jgi:hypothetical protein
LFVPFFSGLGVFFCLEHAEDSVRLLGIWWARIMIFFGLGGGSFLSFFP